MHLLCLVGASIRNARMHHSASVDLAPPIRGKHLSESERMVVESYLRKGANILNFMVTYDEEIILD